MLHWRRLNLSKKPGLTLVEMLVAIAIAGLLITALYAIFITSYKSYQRSVNRSELDQNARISLERITRDLRQASKIVTILPPTNTDPLNPAPSNIKFCDGHNTDKIQYVEYSSEGNNLIRKVMHYYFSSDPENWVAIDTNDEYGNPPLESIDENVVKADKIGSLEFYGETIINIGIVVANQNNNIAYKTQVLGRNIR